MLATSRQIKHIHTMRSMLCIDEPAYRDMLASYGVTTSVALEREQAEDLIKKMQVMSFNSNFWVGSSNVKTRYEDLSGRLGIYATPKQLRMIEATWMTHPHVREKNVDAMNSFIFAITKINHIRWLLKADVSRVLHAIQRITPCSGSKK